MGSFDRITVPCPRCQEPQEIQSKGGACMFRHYTLQNAPPDVLGDANRHAPFTCEKCKATFKVHVVCMAQTVLTVPNEVENDDEADSS